MDVTNFLIVLAFVIYVAIANPEHHWLLECVPFTQNDSYPRIMVAGRADFIGMALVKRLRQMNYTSVKIIGDVIRGRQHDFSNEINGESMMTEHRDFCTRDLSVGRGGYRLLVNTDWVIHLAISDAVQFDSELSLLHQTRIDANLMRSARHNNVSRYIYMGSKTTSSFATTHTRKEHTLAVGDSSYIYHTYHTRSDKLSLDHEISHTRNIHASFLEVFSVYGDGANYSNGKNAHLISSIIWRSINDTVGGFSFISDGMQMRDYVFVDDVVNALVLAIQKEGFEGKIQIGSGYTTSLQNVTDYIANLTRQCLKKGIQIDVRPARDSEIELGAAVVEKGYQELSWAPIISINIGIAMNYAWVLKDMAKRNTSNREQLLQYAHCIDGEISLQKQKYIAHPVIQSKAYSIVHLPPPGLILTSVPKFFCPGDRKVILDSIKDLKAPRKTLVIITTSTRAHHITFQNFQSNVLDVLNADLALSVETQKYPVPDGYRSAAKYVWEINPPKDFDFMHFYDQISTNCFNHRFNETYAEVIGAVGAVAGHSGWLGCINAAKQNACCAQMLFYRWFALQNILKEKLYLQYDTVIVTRSDFYWVGPHEKLDVERGNVYVPHGKDYGGVYDRHYVLSMYDAISALGHAEIVMEREDPNEQKQYLISQGCDNGVNLEYSHYNWLTNMMRLRLHRYPHSGLLVSDASDGTVERWGKRTLRNINGLWVLVKYDDELEPLRRFNIIFYRKQKFGLHNLYSTIKMYFGL